MSKQASQTLVANFDSFELADAAAKFLRAWEKAQPDIKIGTLSLICETDEGELKVRHYGPRNTLQGAVTGVILGMFVGRLVGLPFAQGMVVGGALGAVAGTLSMRQPELSPEEQSTLTTDLAHGKAALVIPIARGPVEDVAAEIEKLDGEVKEYNSLGERVRMAPNVAATVPA